MDRASHLAKAEACERFVGSLDRADDVARPWIVAALFYAGLHYIDAYLAHYGHVMIGNHEERRTFIRRRLAHLRDVKRAYEQLEQISWRARYDAVTVTMEDLRRAEAYFPTVKHGILAALPR